MFTASSQNADLIRSLAEAFQACPVGETITYSRLSNAVGFPVQNRFYLVLSAIRLANAESGANFKNIRTVGYQRLPSSMAHILGGDARARGRRLFSRTSSAIANTLDKANDVSNEDRLKAYREQVALGLLQHMARNRNLPVISEGSPPPPITSTVRDSVKLLREHLTSVYG